MPIKLSRLSALFPVSLGLIVAGSVRVPNAPSPEALENGLKIWRKPGAIQRGAACATCHSPDGIELAVYDFDDNELTRRSRPHLGIEDTATLIRYVHALRLKLGIVKPIDPIEFRPLQPGGKVLAGKTPAERDLAFGRELESKLPLLTGPPIASVAQARAAESQLLALNPGELKIGIPLNRLSEDVVHGSEHSSIAQWLPEMPPALKEEDLTEWYQAQDRYLANPTYDELQKLIDLHTSKVNSQRMVSFSALSALKFRALMVFQHRLRTAKEAGFKYVAPEVLANTGHNPIWEVGDFARLILERTPSEIGMEPEVQAKKLTGPSLREQLKAIRLSWFWAGWLSDQGQFKTSQDNKTRLGMWMSQSLSEDGPYPIHSVYANARRQAVVSNDPDSWTEPLTRKRRIWDFAGLRSFRYYDADLPTEAAYRKLYIAFATNCFLMNLNLLKSDILRTHEVWIKISTKANASELLDFVKKVRPETKTQVEALRADLNRLIDQAKERH